MKADDRWEPGLRTHKESVMRLADCIGYRMKNDQAVIWQEKLIKAGIESLTCDDVCDRLATERSEMPKLPELISLCQAAQYQMTKKSERVVSEKIGIDPDEIVKIMKNIEKFSFLPDAEKKKIKEEFDGNFPGMYDHGNEIMELKIGDSFLYRWQFERVDFLKNIAFAETEAGKERLRKLL